MKYRLWFTNDGGHAQGYDVVETQEAAEAEAKRRNRAVKRQGLEACGHWWFKPACLRRPRQESQPVRVQS